MARDLSAQLHLVNVQEDPFWLLNMFQMGWNHQLVLLGFFNWRVGWIPLKSCMVSYVLVRFPNNTFDGSEIRLTSWQVDYPIISRVLWIPGVLPSTVHLQEFPQNPSEMRIESTPLKFHGKNSKKKISLRPSIVLCLFFRWLLGWKIMINFTTIWEVCVFFYVFQASKKQMYLEVQDT